VARTWRQAASGGGRNQRLWNGPRELSWSTITIAIKNGSSQVRDSTDMPERYLSEALQTFPSIAHHTAPLFGVEAEIYNRLWRAIIEGKLKPETKLREDVIGETFAISRTVVRKVMFIMEQEGIVELPPNRGAYVAKPSPDDARDALEAARVISLHVVSGLAAPHHTIGPDLLERIRRHIAIQVDAESADDFARTRIISGEFLVLLVHVYGNRVLAGQFENLISRMTLAASLYQRGERLLRAGAAFQKDVLQRILDHDEKGAGVLMAGFYDAVERSFRYDSSDGEPDLRAILGASLSTPRAASKKKGGQVSR
jgi:DNA-binding GntR family transcriptional regulator